MTERDRRDARAPESTNESAAGDDQRLFELIDHAALRPTATAGEITAAFVERIARAEGTINAVLTPTFASARAEADALDRSLARGAAPGLLARMVFGVKDDIDVASVRCTVGSKRWSHWIPQVDARAVTSLRKAGAVIVGKLNLSEFALGSTGDNAHFGPVRNPWDLSRYAGGSSSGSAAAVAADFCIAALGSDAGGSIRIPAALCGVTGLRPSFGSVPSGGAHEISPSLETIGTLARSAADVARAYLAIGTPSAERRAGIEAIAREVEPNLYGLTIGLPEAFFFEGVEPDVSDAVRSVADQLAALGANVQDVTLSGAESVVRAGRSIIVTDAYAIHERCLSDLNQ